MFKMLWMLLIVLKNRVKVVYEYIFICNKIKFINYERWFYFDLKYCNNFKCIL